MVAELNKGNISVVIAQKQRSSGQNTDANTASSNTFRNEMPKDPLHIMAECFSLIALSFAVTQRPKMMGSHATRKNKLDATMSRSATSTAIQIDRMKPVPSNNARRMGMNVSKRQDLRNWLDFTLTSS
jgi:hypothetical protein